MSRRHVNGGAALLWGIVSSVPLAAPAAANPLAIVVAEKGDVEVIPASRGAPQRAVLGRTLERGDKIRLGPATTATLFFSDGNVIELGERSTLTVTGRLVTKGKGAAATSVPSEVFAQASRFLVGGSRQSGLTMLAPVRGASELTPILTSPRRTGIISDRPIFVWRAVKEATRYRLAVSDQNGEVWNREAQTTMLSYPNDAPPLRPESDYLWEVQAFSDRGSLRKEESVFHVLSWDQATLVRDHLLRIDKMVGNRDSAATRFIKGTYLFGRGLYQDAVEQFTALCRIEPETAAPHEALGKVYGAIGLMDLSAAEFEKALTLSHNY